MAGIGHNSGFADTALLSFVERIERLAEEKQALGEDMKEVYSEAKGSGFDTRIMRQVISLRKMDPSDRQEREAILDLYMSALDQAQKAQVAQSVEDGA